jgi:hypothetical protein
MNPQVIVDWMGRSDSAQHGYGVGSPEALAALRLIDGQIGLLLQRVRQMNLEDKTDIIVTCDHGFDYEPQADLLAPLRDSGFADDVVTDNEGGSTLLYVKNHDAERIARLVAKFQASRTTNAIFVQAKRPAGGALLCSPGAVKGFLPGTFALDLAALSAFPCAVRTSLSRIAGVRSRTPSAWRERSGFRERQGNRRTTATAG